MLKLSFAQPLWLAALVLVLVFFYWSWRQPPQPSLRFSLGARLKAAQKQGSKLWLQHLGLALRCLALSLSILALARPQFGRHESKQRSEGLDMMLVVDTSRSMLAMDFTIDGQRRNRLQVAQKVLAAFIEQRSDDRLGLTVFGSQAFAYVPLTLDHEVLLDAVHSMEIGMAGDSTAIGDALGIAVNRLKGLKAKSKIVIILTDGANEAGKVEPLDAAKAAAALGVRIYTVGIGSSGLVPFPTPLGLQQVRFELDEGLLQNIATTTQGQYFRAKDTESLLQIYKTIDRLEKATVEVQTFHQLDEKFAWFLWPALLCLMLELCWRLSPWRRLP